MPCRINWKVMDVDARVKAAPDGKGGAETGMGYGGSPIGETSRFPTILRRESKLFFESASLSNREVLPDIFPPGSKAIGSTLPSGYALRQSPLP